MKYNRAEIMRRAWRFNKRNAGTAVTFSDCLKVSWLQAKVEAGVITMADARVKMAELGLVGKGAKKEEKAEVKQTAAKNVENNPEKDALIEKLEAIAAERNSYNNGYHYEVIVSDWKNYGKDRTYLKIEETRDYSKHDKIRDYGYYDNVANKYVPARYADIDSDYNKYVA